MTLPTWFQNFLIRFGWVPPEFRRCRPFPRLATRVLVPEERILMFGLADYDMNSVPAHVLILKNNSSTASPLEITGFSQPSSGGSVSLLDNPSGPGTDQLLFTVDPEYTGNIVFTFAGQDATGSQTAGNVAVTATAGTISAVEFASGSGSGYGSGSASGSGSSGYGSSSGGSGYGSGSSVSGSSPSGYGSSSASGYGSSYGSGSSDSGSSSIGYESGYGSSTAGYGSVSSSTSTTSSSSGYGSGSSSSSGYGYGSSSASASGSSSGSSGYGSGTSSESGYGSGSSSSSYGSSSGSASYGSSGGYGSGAGVGSASGSGSSVNTPPTIATLNYRNSITWSGVSHGEFWGTISDATPTSSTTIEIATTLDVNLQTTPFPSSPNNPYDLSQFSFYASMAVGNTTIWARANEYDNALGSTVVGGWQAFAVNDGFVPNAPPVILDLALSNGTQTEAGFVTDDPVLVFRPSDTTPHAMYDVDIDYNGDGEYDRIIIADGQLDQTMTVSLRDDLGRGTHTVQVRAVEYLETNGDVEYVYGNWSSITFTTTHNRESHAVDDAYEIVNDGAEWTFNPLANDFDPDGDSLSITSLTEGYLFDDLIRYTPTLGFVGQQTITYTIADSHGSTSTAQITIDVAAPPPQVVMKTIDSLDDEIQFELLSSMASQILGPTLGPAFVLNQGVNATKELIKKANWGWKFAIDGEREDADTDQINTTQRIIRIANHIVRRYGSIDGEPIEVEHYYTTAEMAAQVKQLIDNQYVTQFATGATPPDSPAAAAISTFVQHPIPRIVGTVGVIAVTVAGAVVLAPAAGAAAVSASTLTALGLMQATATVAASYAVVVGTHDIIVAGGELTGHWQAGDTLLIERTFENFTGNQHSGDDLRFSADLAVTIVELGAGLGYIIFRGKAIPKALGQTKSAVASSGLP